MLSQIHHNGMLQKGKAIALISVEFKIVMQWVYPTCMVPHLGCSFRTKVQSLTSYFRYV